MQDGFILVELANFDRLNEPVPISTRILGGPLLLIQADGKDEYRLRFSQIKLVYKNLLYISTHFFLISIFNVLYFFNNIQSFSDHL